MKEQASIIYSQQLFIEQIDNVSRENKLIITGVAENEPLEAAENDEEKILHIASILDVPNLNYKHRRIGQDTSNTRIRPIMLIVNDPEQRKKLLNESKKLKALNGFQKVFIKKDKHPAVRKEWSRLFKVKQEEENKPENSGRKISIDFKNRKVLKDNMIIDSWKPMYF